MPFVERDPSGAVISVRARPEPSLAEEFIEETHADLIAYRAAAASRAAEPNDLETLIEMLRDGDPAFDAERAAARQRIIDRRP